MRTEIFRSFHRELKKTGPVTAKQSLALYQSLFASLDREVSETHVFEQVRGNEVLIHQAKEEVREAIAWVVANVPSLQNSESAPLARYNIEKCIQATCKAIHRLTKPFNDKLTGLFNRAFFEEISIVIQPDYTVFMIDLDNFKQLNDTQGHGAGDEYIKTSAEYFKSIIRSGTDYAIRYGGDEFVLLVQSKDPSVIERIKGELDLCGAKFSYGVASSNEEDDFQGVFNKADAEMYICKNMKKNIQLLSEKKLTLIQA